MQLNHLEVFCMVANLKSFSKSAKLLYMSQPAVSNHIHTLEDYYGTKLFNRHNHGVTLTEAGQVVYNYAQELLRIHDTMGKEIDKVLNKESKKLVVGASSSVGNYALPCSVWTFKEKYPDIDICLEISNSTTIIQQVLDGKINLGVVEGPVVHENIESYNVFDDQLILIVPPTEEWLNREEVTLEDIKKYPLIMREQGSGIRTIWEKMVESTGFDIEELKITAEMGSIDAIKSAVESGLGVAVMCRLAAQKELSRGTLKGILVKDVTEKIVFQIICRKDNLQPSITTRFIHFLCQPTERSFC